MDIKAKISELVTKISSDEALQQQFKANPTKAVESLIGVDLPEDQINQIVAGVKAKLNLDGAASSLGKLFGK